MDGYLAYRGRADDSDVVLDDGTAALSTVVYGQVALEVSRILAGYTAAATFGRYFEFSAVSPLATCSRRAQGSALPKLQWPKVVHRSVGSNRTANGPVMTVELDEALTRARRLVSDQVGIISDVIVHGDLSGRAERLLYAKPPGRTRRDRWTRRAQSR